MRETVTWDLDDQESEAVVEAIAPILAAFDADARSRCLEIRRSYRKDGMIVTAYPIDSRSGLFAGAMDKPIDADERRLLKRLILSVRHIAPALRALEFATKNKCFDLVVREANCAEAAIIDHFDAVGGDSDATTE